MANPSHPRPRNARRATATMALLLACCAAFLAGCTAFLACSSARQASAQSPPSYRCERTAEPIKIDGVLDEKSWQQSQLIDDFAAHWAGEPPAGTTRARLLWDDEALYFSADMDDADLYADKLEHDDMIWLNDVFELFFKPSQTERPYYEFQVSAANTHLDMLLPSRGSGGYERWVKAEEFHLESAVALQGTLNQWRDQDHGWIVEGRLPWADFSATGGRPTQGDVWHFTLCRYDYSTQFEHPRLSSSAHLTEGSFHHYEDYSSLEFAGPR